MKRMLSWVMGLGGLFGRVGGYKVAKMSMSESLTSDFNILLNSEYELMFDTGAAVTWIKTADVDPDGMPIPRDAYRCSTFHSFGVGTNEIVANRCVERELCLGDSEICWNAEIELVNHKVGWWPMLGLTGASRGSAFVRAHPVFSLYPGRGTYYVTVGSDVPKTSLVCTDIAVTQNGLKNGKWLIHGKLAVDDTNVVTTEFEVDTGCTPLTMTQPMFDAYMEKVKRTGARIREHSISAREHEAIGCDRDLLPPVKYFFKGEDGKHRVLRIEPTEFVRQPKPGLCNLIILALPKSENKLVIGVPLLRSVVTRFNAIRETVSFCE